MAGKSKAVSSSSRGLGLGKEARGPRRYRKILRENIQGVTKGSIRRVARRGGVKRISAGIYDDARKALKDYLVMMMKDITAVVEDAKRKTITVSDVVFVLNRNGRPMYGFGEAQRVVRDTGRK